jgi:hypothetical protein
LVDWETLSRNERFRRLEEVQEGLGDIMADLQARNPLVALGPFSLAATLHLHLHYLRYRLFRSELSPLRARANRYAKHVLSLLEEIQTQAGLRYSLEPVLSAEGVPVQPEVFEYWVEGKLVDTLPPAEANTKRLQDIAAATGPTVDRLMQIAMDWRGGQAEDSVREAFCRVLERPVDDATLAAYVDAFRNGLTERNLVRELALSDEHQLRFLSMHIPTDTVRVLFDHVVARQPDQQEQITYKTILSRRGGKAVIEDLLTSIEYDQRFGDYKIPGNGRAGCF